MWMDAIRKFHFGASDLISSRMMFFHFNFGEKAQGELFLGSNQFGCFTATALGFCDRYEILKKTVLMWDYHI
jgi:hypothetical protein